MESLVDERLEGLVARIERDIEDELYDGAAIAVGQNGKLLLDTALGFHERAENRALEKDAIFATFSICKTFTVVAFLRAICDAGLSLDTRVSEIVPSFGSRGKHRINFHHVMTHSLGLESFAPPVPPEQLGDLHACFEAVCDLPLLEKPGCRIRYSRIVGHCIMGALIERLDPAGRRFKDIMEEDFFSPLGMVNTSFGLSESKAAKRVPVVYRDTIESIYSPIMIEQMSLLLDSAEIPAASGFSTAGDMYRWCEMLRLGGRVAGRSFIPGPLLARATTVQTGDESNEFWDFAREMFGWPDFPANIGYTFFLRGTGVYPNHMGQIASPSAFGGIGAGTTAFWVDPDSQISFACLTAGAMEESRSVERFGRLSDIVHSALA